MRAFLDKDFLLETETAKHLYHDYSKEMPILDYHCHLNPKEIFEDICYENITQLWLSGDHYKWRLMRAQGVEERYITGDATDKEKFFAWAWTLEMAIGSPLYHWCHLELQRYFGFEKPLNEESANEAWEFCNEKLRAGGLSARSLIRNSNVEVVCTTDDPIDSLEWHRKLANEEFPVKVLPTFRPDRALHMEKADFGSYLAKLEEVGKIKVDSFQNLKSALSKRLAYFVQHGCKVTDHGLEYLMYEDYTEDEIEVIFKKRLEADKHENAKKMTDLELKKYKSALLEFLGREYHRHGLIMQLHFGVQRDLNRKIFSELGADAGIDAINNYSSSIEMGRFLNALAKDDCLPKTILYSLNPTDNAAIDTVIGCFQDSSCIGKVQHGTAWWFNDHKQGMEEQMISLANLGLLGNFIGMLTDSRSFTSYARHEYFRRILCNLIGKWVENGEYPKDERSLKKIVEGISYKNAKRYFGF